LRLVRRGFNMKRLPWCVALCVVALASFHAQAAIKVGDSVTSVSYKADNGGDISIAALKGKLVLIDFWATWCKPCMNEAPHMVAINEKYKAKGLVVLGISLDREAAGMLQGAKAAKLDWPQVIDGGRFSAMFGVDSIPRTFLVGPDGSVLWTGHPASGLDAAIEDALKNHPPFLVDPAIVADASKVLDEIEQKIGSKDARGALKLLAGIPANARLDQKFADRSTAVQKKLEDAAEGLLAAASAQAQAGSYPEAIKSLRELADGLTGLDVAVKAKKQLADLLGKPEVKAAVAKADQDKRDAEREALANIGLTAARKLQADGKHGLAYARFKQVVADFAGTPSAATAAEQVKVYNKEHPEFAQGEKDAVVGTKARAALSMAESYKNSGNYEAAKSKYRSIIATYPRTEYAETARQELQRMGQ
jgi:thiol-disulfide isomerase/thioredoxin